MPPKKGGKKNQQSQKRPSTSAKERSATPQSLQPSPDGSPVRKNLLDQSTAAMTASATGRFLPEQHNVVAFAIGTEYASVALLPTMPGGRGEVIANEDDFDHVYIHKSVGTPAKTHIVRNMKATVRRFLPLVGLSFDSPEVQEAKKWSIVPIVPHPEDNTMPCYAITTSIPSERQENEDVANGDNESIEETQYLTPAELLTMMLKGLKGSAESYTGVTISHCVLSHPVDFRPIQCTALVEAAKMANLITLSIIPETSAGLLLYECIDQTAAANTETIAVAHKPPTNTLILDIGALTTTLSLFNVSLSLYTHLYHRTTLLSANLGGLALDQTLLTHFATEFKRKSKVDVLAHRKASEKLLLACETTRKVLSTQSTANCHVESIYQGMDMSSVVNRVRFESLCRKWKLAMVDFITESLEEATFLSAEIDEVILLGGVVRTPFVVNMVQKLFPSSRIRNLVEPGECVGLGCAVHGFQVYVNPSMTAYVIDKIKRRTVENGVDKDHSSINNSEKEDELHKGVKHLQYPLGLLDTQNKFVVVLPRGTPIPVKHHFRIDCKSDTKSVWLRWAEGRGKIAKTNLANGDSNHNDNDDGDEKKDESEDKELTEVYEGTELSEMVLKSAKSTFNWIEVSVSVVQGGGVHVRASGHENGGNHHAASSVVLEMKPKKE